MRAIFIKISKICYMFCQNSNKIDIKDDKKDCKNKIIYFLIFIILVGIICFCIFYFNNLQIIQHKIAKPIQPTPIENYSSTSELVSTVSSAS